MWNYFCLLPRTPYLSLPTLPCFPLPSYLPSNDACSLVSPTTASTPIPAATIPLAGHSAIPRDSPIAVTDPLLSADAFTNLPPSLLRDPNPAHPPSPLSRHRSHALTFLIEHLRGVGNSIYSVLVAFHICRRFACAVNVRSFSLSPFLFPTLSHSR